MTSTLPVTLSSRRKRRNALSEALPMFKEGWIRDHLLGKAPTTDAAIISSPLQQLHAISFENDLRFDPVDRERVGRDVSSLMSSESVMVPAYSRDGFNLGFCLSETAGLASKNFIECHNGDSIQHFTFREDNGFYVAVTRHSHAELLMLLSVNDGKREMAFFCFAFPGNSFSTLIEQGVDDPAAFERILCANVFTTYERQCPYCGASIGTYCNCELHLKASKMPLDLSAIVKNISMTQLGSGKGSGLFEVFSDGVPIVSIPVNARSKACYTVKQGRAKRFVERAIADVLKDTPVEVKLGLASPLEDGVVRNTQQTNPGQAPDSEPATDDCQQTTNSSSLDANSTVFEEYPTSFDYTYPAIRAPNQVLTTTECTVSEVGLTISEDITTSTFPSTVEHAPESALGTRSGELPPISNSYFESPIPLTTAFELSSTRGVTHGKLLRALPIAPRNVVNTVPIRSTGPPMTEEAKLRKMTQEVREWRAYHRKIRNRESAIRSNMVKKQRSERARRNQRNTPGDAAV